MGIAVGCRVGGTDELCTSPADSEPSGLGDGDALGDRLGDGDSSGVGDGLGDVDALGEWLCRRDGLALALGLAVDEARVRLEEGFFEGVADAAAGVFVAIGDALAVGAVVYSALLRSTTVGLPLSHGIGSVNCPSTMTSKWRWQPVEYPVDPTSPIPSSTSTFCPTATPIAERWLYVVTTRWPEIIPWSILTCTPLPPAHPVNTTVPARAAPTGVPQAAAQSCPVCSFQ